MVAAIQSTEDDALALAAEEINALVNAVQWSIWRIGRILLDAKAEHPGRFVSWVNASLPFSISTAENYMNVAQRLPEAMPIKSIQARALYALAAKSAPDDVRNWAVERAEMGETITMERVYVQRHAPPELVERVDAGELSPVQAKKITDALRDVPEDVRTAALGYRVSQPEVVQFLADAYKRRDANPERETTWRDVIHNEGRLEFDDDTVSLADATARDCDAYLRRRAYNHTLAEAKKQLVEKHIECTVREDGRILIEPDAKYAPGETVFVSIYVRAE